MDAIRRILYNLRLVLVVLAVIVSPSTMAHADSVTYNNYSVLNNQTVQINDATLNINNETGGSGQVTLFNINTGGFLTTWCVDIVDNLLTSGSFTGIDYLSGPIGDNINALISHGTPLLNIDYNASAALQVAIWTTKYGVDLNIAAPQPVVDEAAAFLANVANGSWTADRTKRVAVLSGGGANQDQAYLVSVPEPMSLALVATGLTAAGLNACRPTLKLVFAGLLVRLRSRHRTNIAP